MGEKYANGQINLQCLVSDCVKITDHKYWFKSPHPL